jgi:tetratricopeptide (TPR) repeat protein
MRCATSNLGAQEGWLERAPKSETRIPKAERRPKSEGRILLPHRGAFRNSDFGFLSAFGFRPSGFIFVLAFVFCWQLAACLHAAEIAPSVQARRAFQEAEARYKKTPAKAEAAWQFARACFDLAEFATNNTERAELADQGIAASRQALTQDLDSAAGHYYLGMNLGQLARTRSLGALKLVTQMERAFSVARDLDEHFDYAGPDRNLGLLYRDAPALGSIGSRAKARQHLERAVALAPDYPENRLNLIEAYLKWGERDSAQRELKALEEGWAAARAKLAGPAWSASWADWEATLQKLKKKLGEPSKPLESPRGRK